MYHNCENYSRNISFVLELPVNLPNFTPASRKPVMVDKRKTKSVPHPLHLIHPPPSTAVGQLGGRQSRDLSSWWGMLHRHQHCKQRATTRSATSYCC